MPIDYSEYAPDWHEISKRIREGRAGNRCEWCGKPNGVYLAVAEGGFWFDVEYNLWRDDRGDVLMSYMLSPFHFITVVLTVAHLNHDKLDNRDENLAALCQSCHLNYDRHRHVRNRKYGRGHDGEHQGRLFGKCR